MIMRRLQDFLAQRAKHPRRLAKGLRDLLLLGVAYSAAILLLAFGKVAPGMASWLAIPTNEYFLWEPIFTTPVIFFGGLLAAAVMQLMARWMGGQGSFEDTVALVGPVTLIATLTTLIPDTLIGLGLIAGFIDPAHWMTEIVRPSPILAMIWCYLVLYLIAFLVLYPALVRQVHGLNGRKALLVGWAGFLVYQALLLVFIR